MSEIYIEKTRRELINCYPGARVIVAEDNREMVAEVYDGLAVVVIERSAPHFHSNITETYRALRGTLCVACGGHGLVLREGESITVEPGMIHFARAADEPAWIEVKSEAPWSEDDHFIL